jgi:signal transduction histidine kinase
VLDISVVDSGVGMSPEQVERLFQPFTKIMENRNLNRDGVGLGLSVSQKIAKALGGSIFVVS